MKKYSILFFSCAVIEMYGAKGSIHQDHHMYSTPESTQTQEAALAANLYDRVGKANSKQKSNTLVAPKTQSPSIQARSSTLPVSFKKIIVKNSQNPPALPPIDYERNPQALKVETVDRLNEFINKFGTHGVSVQGNIRSGIQSSTTSELLLRTLDKDHKAIDKNFEALLSHSHVSQANKEAIRKIRKDVQNTYDQYKVEIQRILDAFKTHKETQAQAAAEARAAEDVAQAQLALERKMVEIVPVAPALLEAPTTLKSQPKASQESLATETTGKKKPVYFNTILRNTGTLSAVPRSQAAIDASSVIESAPVKERMKAFQQIAKDGEPLKGAPNEGIALKIQENRDSNSLD